jgi:hypothetical protein
MSVFHEEDDVASPRQGISPAVQWSEAIPGHAKERRALGLLVEHVSNSVVNIDAINTEIFGARE